MTMFEAFIYALVSISAYKVAGIVWDKAAAKIKSKKGE